MSKYTNQDLCNKVADIKYDVQQVLDALYSRDHELESLRQENANLRKHKERLTDLEIQLRNKIYKLKSECELLEERIDDMKDATFADRNTIKHLKDKIRELKQNK